MRNVPRTEKRMNRPRHTTVVSLERKRRERELVRLASERNHTLENTSLWPESMLDLAISFNKSKQEPTTSESK